MAKNGKQKSAKADPKPAGDPRIAKEEAAIAKLEEEAKQLREKIALEEAQREEIIKEQHAVHGEWLFDRLRLNALLEDQTKTRASIAEQRSLHATQARHEKQRVLKIRLRNAAAAASSLLHAQAALLLREQQHIAHLSEAEAVVADFRKENFDVLTSRALLLGAIRMHHDECVLQVRKAAERKEADILQQHEVKTNQLREAKDRGLRRSINALEEQKTQQIAAQQMESKKLSQNTKRFFSDVTSASLSLIRQLKKEQEELKHIEARSTKTLAELHAVNRSFAEPLSKLREETAQLQHTLQVYTAELQQITKVKEACRKQEKLCQDLSLQQEVLQQQLIELQKEKEALAKQLDAAVLQLHRKRTLENTILEKKLAYLKEAAEVANTQQALELECIHSNAGASQTPISENFTKLLKQKQDQEQKLVEQIQSVKELHARTLDAFLGALHASGLATEDLGVELLEGTKFDIKRQPQIQIETS
ncbi:hypothetical protein Esti_000301 [Eimeria stiedai]